MGKSTMTQTLLADDYKIAPANLPQTPHFRGVAEVGAHPAGHHRQAELSSEPAAIPQTRSRPATPARSRLGLLCANFVKWLKGCADAYAAAAAYENLSRLSDTELRHRGLSRDVLARDLMKW